MNRFDVLERDSFTCVYCGFSAIEEGADLEVDHIVPTSLGGKNTASNLVTACWHCNQGKAARGLAEVERVLHLVAERNDEKMIKQTQQYFPKKKGSRIPTSAKQKERNKILLRSLNYYKKKGWYGDKLEAS